MTRYPRGSNQQARTIASNYTLVNADQYGKKQHSAIRLYAIILREEFSGSMPR
jgi:hypothetical protein